VISSIPNKTKDTKDKEKPYAFFLSGSRLLLVEKQALLGRKVEVNQRKIYGSLVGNSSHISIKWTSKPPKLFFSVYQTTWISLSKK
jgi:hypothetical protein